MFSRLTQSLFVLTTLAAPFAYAQTTEPKQPTDSTAVDKMKEGVRDAKTSAQAKLYDVSDKTAVDISFPSGKASLDRAAQDKLKALFQANQGKKLDVVIAAWSDQDLAAGTKAQQGPKDQVNLAAQRIDAVEKAVKQMHQSVDIEHTYNMAKAPNAVQELFNTQDAEVKGMVSGTKAPENNTLSAEAEEFRALGGRSKVVVMIRPED